MLKHYTHTHTHTHTHTRTHTHTHTYIVHMQCGAVEETSRDTTAGGYEGEELGRSYPRYLHFRVELPGQLVGELVEELLV